MSKVDELAEAYANETDADLLMCGYDIGRRLEQAFKAGYEAAQPKWVSVEERLPEDKLLIGEFEVEPSYFVTPIIGFKVKNGRYYDQNGSHLPPEYIALVRWCKLPEPPEDV